MQEITEKKRNLEVTHFDRIRIHSSIMSAMRRKRIPMTMRGGDLIRGTVFGLIDHPDYSMEVAVERAVEMSSMPSCPETVEDAYAEMFDCIETVMREDDFYDEDGKRMNHVEIVNRAVKGLAFDIKKDYCYSLTVQYLQKAELRWNRISTEIVKNMVFKKLVADESTKECMYQYAYRKSFADDSHKSFEEVEKIIDECTQDVLSDEFFSVYEMVLDVVDHIHEKN